VLLMNRTGTMLLHENEQDRGCNVRRRGSILVLVLGVLALMAVFAAVYMTIGLGDQRAASAVEARQQRDELAPQIGDYIADVIARDRLAIEWRTSGTDGGLAQLPYRETTDYSYTDYELLSIPTLGDNSGRRIPPNQIDLFRFRPEGSIPEPFLGNPLNDQRTSSDPWLASTEPTYLGSPAERAFPNDPTKWWLDNRDWLQISNVAPDGLFVNLYALRNNFDAERGYRNDSQMSYWLSLIEGAPGARLQATLDLPWGGTADPNRPFHWTMYQRNMFFPIGQPFLFNDRFGNVAGWDSPDFPLYQYADADGDGFADSRWFELRDSTIPDEELNLLANSGDYRVFAAVRIVDLSAAVNVNTATDGLIAPTVEVPAGSSPAEIDLRRLLTLEDAALDMRATIPEILDEPLSYQSIPRPRQWGSAEVEDAASDYSLYEFAQSAGTVPDASLKIGWFGYDALVRTMQADLLDSPYDVRGSAVAPPDLSAYDPTIELLPVSPFEYLFLSRDPGNPGGPGEHFGVLRDMDRRAMNRLERYQRVGRLDPLDLSRRASDREEPESRFGAEIFGIADLSELLTYRGLNDPAALSRLEAAVDGRLDDAVPEPWLTTRRFGPMRSNRALNYERYGHDDREAGQEFRDTDAQPDGLIDDDALALTFMSPRSRLTTISGGAELNGALSLSGTQSRFGLRLQAQESKTLLRSAVQSQQSLFALYRRALAPHASIDQSWQPFGAGYDRYRTLFYGYQGPELAVRAAAHLALNMKDQYDSDSDPSVATLINTLTNPNVNVDPLVRAVASDPMRYPGGDTAQRLVLPFTHANTNPGNVESEALNIFGIEPQPFIVQAMTITVLTDAPRTNVPAGEPNGDVDWQSGSCDPPTPGQRQPAQIPITIGSKLTSGDWASGESVWDKNADFAMQVFAVKLHNPFNEPITLGRNAADRRSFDYYIEYGGRYYKLAQYTPPNDLDAPPRYGLSPVTIQPGATRVFFALSQEDEQRIVDRWQRYVNAYGGPGVQLEFDTVLNWLYAQFQLEELDANNTPVWMRRFDPETGLLLNVADENDDDPDDGGGSFDTFDDLFEFPQVQFPSNETAREPEWQTVRLWKKVINDSGLQRETDWRGSPDNTDNWIQNDLLVDRLREPDPDPNYVTPDGITYPDPSRRVAHLDSRPAFAGGYDVGTAGGPRVTGTRSCDQNLAPLVNGFQNDNTGWTIASHSFIRRRGFNDNSSARQSSGSESLRRGVLPQWCIETIQNRASPGGADYQGEGEPQNIKGGEHPGSSLSDADFDFNEPWAFRRFSQFMGENDPVEDTFNQTPNEWNGPQYAFNMLRDVLYGPSLPPNGARPRDTEFIVPELHVRNDKLEYTPAGSGDPIDISRLTDILAPYAIGPEYDPRAASDLDNDPTLPGRWLTLSEAMGLALAYDRAPDGVYSRYIYFDPHKRLVTDRPGTPPSGDAEYVFDRCQLWLTKFVPFVNQDSDPDGAFNPQSDRVLGTGVPPALVLLDSIRAGDDDLTANEVLQTALPGKININTAPLSVLRTIGMLSPSTSWDIFGVPENWAWRVASEYGGLGPSGSFDPAPYIDWAKTNLGLPDLSFVDAASTLIAYRDRLRYIPFRVASFPPSLLPKAGLIDSGFVPDDGSGALFHVTNPELALVEDNRINDVGRSMLTGIIGLRERPGFASLGEIFAARIRPDLEDTFDARTLPYRINEVETCQVDALSSDRSDGANPQELKAYEHTGGGANFRIRLEPAPYTDFDPFEDTSFPQNKQFVGDELGNDYDEQLAIASQVLNLVTTRSDYFAVWFVVQGYTREDVSNLGENDPMIPSFARRYLMVVDRTRVGTWVDRNGDGIEQEESEIITQPRIVLFREVPM